MSQEVSDLPTSPFEKIFADYFQLAGKNFRRQVGQKYFQPPAEPLRLVSVDL